MKQFTVQNFEPLSRSLIIKSKINNWILDNIDTPITIAVCKKYKIPYTVVQGQVRQLIVIDTSKLDWYYQAIIYKGLYGKLFRKILIYFRILIV